MSVDGNVCYELEIRQAGHFSWYGNITIYTWHDGRDPISASAGWGMGLSFQRGWHAWTRERLLRKLRRKVKKLRRGDALRDRTAEKLPA